LPAWVKAEVPQILSMRYQEWLAVGERAGVEGSLWGEEESGSAKAFVELTVYVDNPARGSRHEATVRLPREGLSERAAIELALDAADAALGEWLEEGRESRHRDLFEEASFDGLSLLLRLRLRHPALEEQAEAIISKELN